MDRQTDRADCITFLANAVGKNTPQKQVRTGIFLSAWAWMQRDLSFVEGPHVNDKAAASRFTVHLVLAHSFIYC